MLIPCAALGRRLLALLIRPQHQHTITHPHAPPPPPPPSFTMAPRPKRPEGPIPVPSALPTRIAVSLVLTATVLHRLVAVSILVLSGVAQGSFDASGQQLVLLASRIQPGASRLQDLAGTIRPFLTPFVRWDTLHFLGAAAPRPIPTPASTMPAWWEGGYAYEHSLAFQPGLSFLLRWTGYVGTSRSPEDWNVEQSILLTTTLAIMAGALAPVLLLLYVALARTKIIHSNRH